MNTIPATDLVLAVIAELEKTAAVAGDKAAVNAANQAAYQIRKHNVLAHIEILDNGDALVPSKKDGGPIYRVTSAPSCRCDAGLNGKLCWHSFLVNEAIAVARELDTPEPDAAVAAFDSFEPDSDTLDFDPRVDADPRYAETLREIDELFPPR